MAKLSGQQNVTKSREQEYHSTMMLNRSFRKQTPHYVVEG